MKFSVCTDSVFSGLKTSDAMKKVKEAGFCAVEFWSWWDKDLMEIKNSAKNLEINISAFCTHFISMVDVKQRANYLEGLKKSAEAASELGCKRLITQVGNNIAELGHESQIMALRETLLYCIPILDEYDITLLFEPLNTLIDHKGYFLSSSSKAFDIAAQINNPHIRVLFDIYHQLVMGEDPCKVIPDGIGYIGHFHIAGYPGRHEISTSFYDYSKVLGIINELKFDSYVGIEYMPSGSQESELKKLLSLYSDL